VVGGTRDRQPAQSDQRARDRGLLSVLPLVVAIAFYLVADIDSPRSGYIHVRPLNLLALTDTLR
jgi:hypothetical protein